MAPPFYKHDEKPGITLYKFWLTMLEQQGVDLRPHLEKQPWSYTGKYPIVSYGGYRCAITVHSFDAQQRPILTYGCRYRMSSVPYEYLRLNADGDFLLVNPHGDNHQAIADHTFLDFGYHGGQYVWFVHTEHGPREYGWNYRPDGSMWMRLDTRDWKNPVPYVRERVIRMRYWNGSPDQRPWVGTERDENGYWGFVGRSEHEAWNVHGLAADVARSKRAYRRASRDPITGQYPDLIVRDGKTMLSNRAAVLHIAALLDVTQPAKAVRRPKAPKEATV